MLAIEAEPRLRRAFIASRGVDGSHEAVAEALAWAWEHRDRLDGMSNPIGYLYRVGQSRTTPRSERSALPAPTEVGLPEIEPGLPSALRALSEQQRTIVWLVHGCGWKHAEVAGALEIAESTVGSHLARAMKSLRHSLGVTTGGEP